MAHIADGFIAQALQQPNQTAIVFSQAHQARQTRSYREVLSVAERVAAIVSPFVTARQSDPNPVSGLNPSVQNTARIGLLLPNCPEFLEIFLGVTIAGGVAMVFDPKWTLTQVQQVIARSAPDLLFVEPEWALQMEGLCEGLPMVRVPQLPQGQSSGAIGNILWEQSSLKQNSGISLDHLATADDAPFYVGFTSGTTGSPKGVVRSHRSWVNSFAASRVEFGTCAADRILVPGFLTHSLSLYAALECLNAGATLYLLPKFSLKAISQLLTSQSITVLVAVPALLKPIAKQVIHLALTDSTLRAVIAGGSKLDLSLRSELPLAFPTAEILEYFGALELSFISLASSREAVPPSSVGRSFYGVEVSVRQVAGGGEAAVGEVGWVGVKSQMFSLGYLNQPDGEVESGYRMVGDWATVGDLGWQDAKGYLYLAGREQDMILSGGMNIYPVEIETVLRQLPEVAEVAVVGVPDGDRGQAICAAIQWVSEPLSQTELFHRLRPHLPLAKCPRYFVAVDQFPKTSTGKIRRSVLQEQIIASLALPTKH